MPDKTPLSIYKRYLPFGSLEQNSPGKTYLIRMDGKIKKLTNLINKAGFDAIVFWEDELKDIKACEEKMKGFLFNNAISNI
jgi:hypothetical protein